MGEAMKSNNCFEKYDTINTIAVRWLKWNHDVMNQLIGLKYFDCKNINHLWLLNQFKNYSIYDNYNYYYIKTNIFTYLYLKYFKKFNKLKLYIKENKNIRLIEPNIFIKEILDYVQEDISIIQEIYIKYYRR